jgi:hypothetical protein
LKSFDDYFTFLDKQGKLEFQSFNPTLNFSSTIYSPQKFGKNEIFQVDCGREKEDNDKIIGEWRRPKEILRAVYQVCPQKLHGRC